MKKLFVFITFGVIIVGVCFAQTTRNENRIIGTWFLNDDLRESWVFNNNGTLFIEGGLYKDSYKYGITETKLIIELIPQAQDINYSIRTNIFPSRTVFSYSISSDGKTLILEYITEGFGSRGIWLMKK